MDLGVIRRRLAELGLELPEPAKPVAAYVPAVRAGDFVYTAGQLPFVAGRLVSTGKVRADRAVADPADDTGYVDAAQARQCARICVINALAAVASVIDSLDEISRIVKVTVYVASDPGFTGQPNVADGCSELLAEIFGAGGSHARSAVGVACLPLNAPVELDLVVELKNTDGDGASA